MNREVVVDASTGDVCCEMMKRLVFGRGAIASCEPAYRACVVRDGHYLAIPRDQIVVQFDQDSDDRSGKLEDGVSGGIVTLHAMPESTE
jgi:hypothetical protein